MKLQLPDDPKLRQQYFILAGIIGAAVVYAAYAFGLEPLIARKNEARLAIEGLRAEIQKADGALKGADKARVENTQILEKIVAQSHAHVLKPRLGNYRLEASETLERYATEAGIQLGSMVETAVDKIPPGSTPQAFKPYAMRADFDGSMEELVRFLAVVEDGNPFASVSSISVSGQPAANPMRHKITVVIEWPVWEQQERFEAIEAALEDLRNPGAKP